MIIILNNPITRRLGLTIFTEYPENNIFFFPKAKSCSMKNMNFDIFLTFVDEKLNVLEEIKAKKEKEYSNNKAFGFIESKTKLNKKDLELLKNKYYGTT